jgi:hypothetical protein
MTKSILISVAEKASTGAIAAIIRDAGMDKRLALLSKPVGIGSADAAAFCREHTHMTKREGI